MLCFYTQTTAFCTALVTRPGESGGLFQEDILQYRSSILLHPTLYDQNHYWSGPESNFLPGDIETHYSRLGGISSVMWEMFHPLFHSPSDYQVQLPPYLHI